MLPKDLKYRPGQRVWINDSARELVPDYVGMCGHVGIGGIAAAHYYRGDYFVNLRLHTGATVILRLPECCLDDAQPKFRL